MEELKSLVKKVLGITNDEYDDFISVLIYTAKDDLLRLGVKEEYFEPIAKPIQDAIIVYCQYRFDETDKADGFYKAYVLMSDKLRLRYYK